MFRYPDKPTRSSVGVLATLVEGDWLAQTKYDGWRCLVAWDGTRATLTSRHREGIPASAGLVGALTAQLRGAAPAVLDGEWMGRRDGQAEGLWLFDLLSLDGEWMGRLPAPVRWARFLQYLPAGPVKPVECVTRNYRAFFEASKRPGAEGIVLKHVTSRIIGSVRSCADNPLWLKVKWRDGEDGQQIVA